MTKSYSQMTDAERAALQSKVKPFEFTNLPTMEVTETAVTTAQFIEDAAWQMIEDNSNPPEEIRAFLKAEYDRHGLELDTSSTWQMLVNADRLT